MAGLSALAKQYIMSDSKFASFSEGEKINLVSAMLMATAEPLARAKTATTPPPAGRRSGQHQAVASAKVI